MVAYSEQQYLLRKDAYWVYEMMVVDMSAGAAKH